MFFKAAALMDVRRIWNLAGRQGANRMHSYDHGTAWASYFLDPEGNTIESYIDTPLDVPQPYAHELDPRKSDERILRETEEISRRQPGYMSNPQYRKWMPSPLQAELSN